MKQRNKVLIVDDNPIDHMITTHILKTCYALLDVMVMECALKALTYLDTNKDDIDQLPSLIILDLDMPGLNGIGFLQKFSERTQTVKNACKIVVLTASDVVADLELMKADPNVIELIAKPLNRTALTCVL